MSTEELQRELAAANDRIESMKYYADWMARIISRPDTTTASEKVQVVDAWKRFNDGNA